MKAATKISDELLSVMEQELQLLSGLIGFARQKERLLNNSDAKSLNEVLVKEEEAALALREKEKERKDRTQALAAAVFLSGKDLPLKKLVEHIDDPACKKRLSDVKSKMEKALKELSDHNARVRELLQCKMDYADFMLNLLYSPQQKNHFYNVQGNMQNELSHINRLEYHA